MTPTRSESPLPPSPKPFLLSLRSGASALFMPPTVYDEKRAITMLVGERVGSLASERYLLGTQTRTERRPEGNDDD